MSHVSSLVGRNRECLENGLNHQVYWKLFSHELVLYDQVVSADNSTERFYGSIRRVNVWDVALNESNVTGYMDGQIFGNRVSSDDPVNWAVQLEMSTTVRIHSSESSMQLCFLIIVILISRFSLVYLCNLKELRMPSSSYIPKISCASCIGN